MGHSGITAEQIVQRFRQHNLDLFEKLHPHYKDSAKLISVVKQGRQQLEEQIAREREEQARVA
jgi:glutathione-regulated potassium-efflux system ancillary protein KefC